MKPNPKQEELSIPEIIAGLAEPYWQLSYTFRQRSYGRYIRLEEVEQLNEMIANFKRFKAHVDQCIELSIEIADRNFLLQRQSQDHPQ